MKTFFFLFTFLKYKNRIFMRLNTENKNDQWISMVKANNYTLKNNMTSGYDGRYNITEILNNTEIEKIKENFNKYNLLKTLEDKKIPIQHKIKLIDNYNKNNYQSVYVTNITKGGLFKDWNFKL
jgi:hypothetical protein